MARSYRPWALVAIGLVLAMALAEVGLRIVDDSVPMRSDWPTSEAELKYRQLTVEGRDPKVIFFGSSFVEAAVDPEQMTFGEAYNLAMPFTTTQSVEWWLDNVVFETTDPQVIVIGIPVWGDIDAAGGDVVGAMDRASRRQAAAGGGWALARTLGAFGQMDQTLARERLIAADVWTDYGHQTGYLDRSVPRSSWEKRTPAPMGAAELVALRTVIELVTSESIDVVLLVEPLANSIAPGPLDVARLTTSLAVLADETGAVLLSPPERFWSDDSFVDGIHFSAVAAYDFTGYVDSAVAALGGRPSAAADGNLRVVGR